MYLENSKGVECRIRCLVNASMRKRRYRRELDNVLEPTSPPRDAQRLYTVPPTPLALTRSPPTQHPRVRLQEQIENTSHTTSHEISASNPLTSCMTIAQQKLVHSSALSAKEKASTIPSHPRQQLCSSCEITQGEQKKRMIVLHQLDAQRMFCA